MKNKKERDRITAIKIKARLKLLKALNRDGDLKFEGMLENNNEMNHLVNYGKPKKTNNKKSKSNYRSHTGGYGSSNNYSPHDVRQLYNYIDNIDDI